VDPDRCHDTAVRIPARIYGTPNLIGLGYEPRPNVDPNCDEKVSGSAVDRLNRWFNTDCFSVPNAGFVAGNASTDPSLRWKVGPPNTQATTVSRSIPFRHQGVVAIVEAARGNHPCREERVRQDRSYRPGPYQQAEAHVSRKSKRIFTSAWSVGSPLACEGSGPVQKSALEKRAEAYVPQDIAHPRTGLAIRVAHYRFGG
jgi:hypothetical protein